VKLRVILTVRSWSGWRWLGRMGSLFFRVVFVDGGADFVDRLFDLVIAQSLL
jgi:hypothetical protein